MAVAPTVPYGLPLFDDTSAITPWQAPFNAISNGLNTALGLVIPVVADLAALAAMTGMPNGANAYVTEGGATFSYNLSSTKWVQQTRATFSTVAARDTAYAKASSVYLIQGVKANSADMPDLTWVYYAAYNATTNPFGTSISGTPTAGWFPAAGSQLAFDSTFSGTISTSVDTVLSGTVFTEVLDLYNMHNVSTNTERIVPGIAGFWTVAFLCVWGTGSTGGRRIEVNVNGVLDRFIDATSGGTVGGGVSQELLLHRRKMSSTDYFSAAVFQTQGASLTASGRISMDYAGPPVGP